MWEYDGLTDGEILELFLDKYPEYENDRIEIEDNNKVWVHCGGAYPLVFKDFVNPY